MFGDAGRRRVHLNAAGLMVERHWLAIPTVFATVRLDDYVVMPNHVHGILRLTAANLDAPRAKRTTVMDAMRWFKSKTTVEYARGVSRHGWRRFEGRLWQRSFYDHIIRNEDDLAHARGYIARNPLRE